MTTRLATKPDLKIFRDPGRCSGQPTVGPSRITVHDIIGLLKLYDWNVEAMIRYEAPRATRDQIDAAIQYFRQNTDEIEAILEKRDADYRRGIAEQQAITG
jgi:uncharacterized protein (DUF433 family)